RPTPGFDHTEAPAYRPTLGFDHSPAPGPARLPEPSAPPQPPAAAPGAAPVAQTAYPVQSAPSTGQLPPPAACDGTCRPRPLRCACGPSPAACPGPDDAPPTWVWADAEYLLWWMKGDSLPPLITSSPAGTPQSQAGVLGAPGTAVLFGGSGVNSDLRSGG